MLLVFLSSYFAHDARSQEPKVKDTVGSGYQSLLNCETSAQFTQPTACHVPSVYLVLNTELTRRK